MNSHGTHFYDSQLASHANYHSQWRSGGVTYAESEQSQRSYPSDRNPGPLGDLYTSVDRTKDARTRSTVVDSGAGVVRSGSPAAASVGHHQLPTGPNVSAYELQHLATFTATGSMPGRLLTPPEGVRRVREMALSGYIWPLLVKVVVSDRELVVIDLQTGEEMEHFPLSLVSDPTCATAVDRRVNGCDVLDNLVLFTVLEDPVKKSSPPEMHVFQCVNRLGQQFVDDILATKNAKLAAKTASSVIAASVHNQQSMAQNTSVDNHSAEQTGKAASRHHVVPPAGQMIRKAVRQEVLEPAVPEVNTEEVTHRGVTLLDRCFSDIEQFVQRVQQAADAYKELDNRRSVRINKHSKHSGDGILNMRAKPPPAADFIDILQKFKLSFILLARLKANIRDPNAPELVHFLFEPLSLVVEACRSDAEPVGSSGSLASRVIAPLPTTEAHDLLDNCLTSKESELLRNLGLAWTTSVDRWQGEIPTYLPRFYDGWQPPAFWLEEIGVPAAASAFPQQPAAQYRRNGTRDTPSDSRAGYARSQISSDLSPNTDHEIRMIELQRRLAQDYQRQREQELSRQMLQTGIHDRAPDNGQMMNARRADVVERYDNRSPQLAATGSGPTARETQAAGRVHTPDYLAGADPAYPRSAPVPAGQASWPQPDAAGSGHYGYLRDRQQPDRAAKPAAIGKHVANGSGAVDDFLQQLKFRNAKIYHVIHARESKNTKELTVRLGEILEVLDDQKNWWKARNVNGDVGYVPKTIIESYSG